MNPTQCKAVAAGFIQALFEDIEVRNGWVTCMKNNWKGLGAFIQATLGLAQTPTDADINAMREYAADEYFCATPDNVQAKDARVEAPYVFNGMNPPPPGGPRTNPPA
jgi:hypothetical protein